MFLPPKGCCPETSYPRRILVVSSSYPRLIVVLLPPTGCCPETSYPRRNLIVVLVILVVSSPSFDCCAVAAKGLLSRDESSSSHPRRILVVSSFDCCVVAANGLLPRDDLTSSSFDCCVAATELWPRDKDSPPACRNTLSLGRLFLMDAASNSRLVETCARRVFRLNYL